MWGVRGGGVQGEGGEPWACAVPAAAQGPPCTGEQEMRQRHVEHHVSPNAPESGHDGLVARKSDAPGGLGSEGLGEVPEAW